ncbi:MAG TPA: type I DNA topoisomerase [Patescibacteria group bacterium]|nr:type I DNA topoisomerase [Patescibacteria group bacterium]
MANKKLVIVESPTKARTLSRFLPSHYTIVSSFGHIRDLPKSTLGVEEDTLTPEYVVPRDKKKVVTSLKKEVKTSSEVFLATDPDREGEAIAWHLLYALGLDEKKFPIHRIVFHEITKDAVTQSLEHPRLINDKLVDAQQARRVLDRLVGYKLSPLLWRKVRRGLSAGRVQSVAVRLIVDRQREIDAFKPEEYWNLSAVLQKDTTQFQAKLTHKENEKIEIKNGEDAKKIADQVRPLPFLVDEYTEKKLQKHAYPPFTTSTLQQAASNRLHFSSKKTMMLAQSLYEEGYITYMRTDSVTLSRESIESTRGFIVRTFGEKYLPQAPQLYKVTSKLAQEAHEAIRPTNPMTTVDKLKDSFTRDHIRLYELIWKRTVASQMNPNEYLSQQAKVSAGEYQFRAQGSKQLFDGWLLVYGGDKNGQKENEKELPTLQKGEQVTLIDLPFEQKFTQPPSQYTEASLIKTLEEKGIGRPSTYAPTISTILERQYVEKKEGKLPPTVIGIAVNDFLVKYFPSIVDTGFTAEMEDTLDDIANGEKKWQSELMKFYEPFRKLVSTVQEEGERVKIQAQETDEVCEKCGGKMLIRMGRYGKFLACGNFPTCKNTKTYEEKIDVPCPKCGGTIVMRRTRKRKFFYGCKNYPKCDFASWTKPQRQGEEPQKETA